MQVDKLHRRIVMDARVLHDQLAQVFPVTLFKQYEGRPISISAFVKRIDAITQQFNIKNILVYVDPVTKTDKRMFFSGEWLPECELPRGDSSADIRIMWHVSRLGKMMQFTAIEWRRIHFYYWTFVMHEMVHRHQDVERGPDGPSTRIYRPRGPGVVGAVAIAEQTYLGDYDEIEAHSHDIALELIAWFPSLDHDDAMRELRTQYTDPAISTYAYYERCFADAIGHPAIGVLDQKIRQWHVIMRANLDFYQTLELHRDGDPLIP